MKTFETYFERLALMPIMTECTGNVGLKIPFAIALNEMKEALSTTRRIYVVGNGGSASIASHCASHYSRGKGMRISPLNDASALTATANDFGYEYSYSKQIEVHVDQNDLVIAISSSGKSQNILNAVTKAKEKKCDVITMSGFSNDNPLRKIGDLNFWVPCNSYGIVELTHMALLHAAFDLMES